MGQAPAQERETHAFQVAFQVGRCNPGPSYLHIPPGDEALALGITGLEELLCLPQHGQLCWCQLLGPLTRQVVQGARAGPAPLVPPARSPGSGDHSPVGRGHPDLSISSSCFRT